MFGGSYLHGRGPHSTQINFCICSSSATADYLVQVLNYDLMPPAPFGPFAAHFPLWKPLLICCLCNSKQLSYVLHQWQQPFVRNGPIFLEFITRGPKLINWSNLQNYIILKERCEKNSNNNEIVLLTIKLWSSHFKLRKILKRFK